jgi:thienamycin biosynthesis protein ThnN
MIASLSPRAATARLREILDLHFDPLRGAPFWIAQRATFDFDPTRDIESLADLSRFGPFRREWLETRPLTDFVPRAILESRSTELLIAETGGTTGKPLRTVFTPEEFLAGFGAPFVAVSHERGFPLRGGWLFAGPSGPHVIGQAARLLARLHGSLEPFCVDFDPRHARAQEPGSLGERLYREHVLEQALDVIERENIEVLFTTPPVVLALSEQIDLPRRLAIRGIHLGGMPIDTTTSARVKEAFPAACLIAAYGNSLFGILPEVGDRDPEPPTYIPHADRLVVELVAEDSIATNRPRAVADGERGRVCMTRLDESCFLPNVIERDVATKVVTPSAWVARGFGPIGLRDPRPATVAAPRGLY